VIDIAIGVLLWIVSLRARFPERLILGERVNDPSQLMPALERAMNVVRDEKRQALVNVCLEASYVKTS
jgi:hypothetical protein